MKRMAMRVSMAAVLAIPAVAVAGGQGQYGQPGNQAIQGEKEQWARQQQQAQAQPRSFEGRITDVRTIRRAGTPHVIVRLENRAGRGMLVDLGPARNLQQQQVDLYWGQPLRGTGMRAQIGNRPALAATSFIADDRQVQVDRGADRRAGQARATPQARAIVQGRVTDTAQVRLQGVAAPHHLIKVQNRGQIAVVDLGPHQPERLNIERGDRVVITGVPGRISGRPVVLARNVAEVRTLGPQQQQMQQQQQQQMRQPGQQPMR